MGASGNFSGYNLFSYCENNPANKNDPAGNFALSTIVGAAIGGAVAGAIVGAISHIASCGLDGNKPTLSGVLGAAATGAVSGMIGAVGGAVGGAAAIVASAAVGVVTGITTAIKTEGSFWEKLAVGTTAGVISAAGTYVGAKIPILGDGGLIAGATAFAGGLFMGTNTEIISIPTQRVVSSAFDKTAGSPVPTMA